MKVSLLCVGKTAFPYLQKGIEEYTGRLKHYTKFQIQELKQPKYSKTDAPERRKEVDSQLLLSHLSDSAYVIILDEGGKEYGSVGFSKLIEKLQIQNQQEVVFIIGGAYGFSKAMYERANTKFSLSQLTLPHDLVRLVFVEQLYRAHTILKGEKYHHI